MSFNDTAWHYKTRYKEKSIMTYWQLYSFTNTVWAMTPTYLRPTNATPVNTKPPDWSALNWPYWIKLAKFRCNFRMWVRDNVLGQFSAFSCFSGTRRRSNVTSEKMRNRLNDTLWRKNVPFGNMDNKKFYLGVTITIAPKWNFQSNEKVELCRRFRRRDPRGQKSTVSSNQPTEKRELLSNNWSRRLLSDCRLET